MANSKYEYVKSFEVQDEIMIPNIIVVRVSGRDFTRFSELHEFEKPYDQTALRLMNACAIKVMEEFPDIALGYGFSDEYSFVFKGDTKIYQRRSSKILSLIGSLFSSAYVIKWKKFFPHKVLKSPPSFKSRVISCSSMEVLQSYLSWRQRECHSKNLYNTCFWKLIKSGESKTQAKEMLKGTQKQDQNERLFQFFNVNYKDLPDILRQGSCAIKAQVEDIVKYNKNGSPVKRLKKTVKVVHSENIVAPGFWNELPSLVNNLGHTQGDINKCKPEYIKSFMFESNLMPSTWIVIRIDGCHFHRFSDVHQFEKPNDEQALNLMNYSAVATMEEFSDVVFSYGVSDEYRYKLCSKEGYFTLWRRASEIVSAFVSFFSSAYVMQWKMYFPQKELIYPPHFDGRAVCYPSSGILLDYLAWRQVDCHINNQYNTCFWSLVKSGKSKSKAQKALKGTQTQKKNELLREFGIDYNTLPPMFRHGSSIFWDKEESMNGDAVISCKYQKKLVVQHCNIIDRSFWKAHPAILEEECLL